MRRRDVIALLAGGLASLPRIVHAQPAKPARIGVLWHAGNAREEGPYFEALKQGFRELGYEEGRTITLEHRFPNEKPERFRSMAAELVASKPDVIVTAGPAAAIAAKNATTTIPIVFIVSDALAGKLVDSLAQPGGNLTGLSNFAVQLSAKRLEYLKQTLPDLARVALLVNPNSPVTRRYVEDSEAAAAQLGLMLRIIEARTPKDLPRAFDAMVTARANGVVVNTEGLFFQGRTTIAKLALDRRLPMCVYSRETLEAGALLSYGPDQRAIFRRAAVYTDKILKGANPGTLPVEQPTRLELLVNLKTAKALGVTIPSSVLLQADETLG